MEPINNEVPTTVVPEVKEVDQGQVDSNTLNPTEDLLTRVSKYKDTSVKPSDTPKDDSIFDTKELEAAINGIEDEKARTQIEGLRKSLLRGANDKFQELSKLQKEAMAVLDSKNIQWTPERVQELTSDPNFVSAAQQLAGTGSDDDEYSTLTDKERAALSQIESTTKELNMMKFNAAKQKEDAELANKYVDYNPEKVDNLWNDLATGKIQATREHLHIIANYEQMIENAYKMGQNESQQVNKEKIEAIGASGINISRNSEPIQKAEGESSRSLFSRILAKNKAALQK